MHGGDELKHISHSDELRLYFLRAIQMYGADIFRSEGMHLEKQLPHHRAVSVYDHSIRVAYLSFWIAAHLGCHVDERALLRGALLHDYFLYDWHEPEKWHRLHGFRHPGFALANARRDFSLSPIEADIIQRHMFPLTPVPPRFRESVIVCVADKVCAAAEVCRKAGS